MPNQVQALTAGPVLVVGATGDLGGRAVSELLARGKEVRALVRDGTDAGALAAKGVQIARGDLLDPASLDRALEGAGAVVTTANGYAKRRPGDSLQTVDDRGNRNLVDAGRRAGIGRFVFTSVLTADKARSVPHFRQKKIIEDYLEASGLPFVSLRPGTLFGGARDFWARNLRNGRLTAIGKPEVPVSSIHIDDAARHLALAVDEPGAVGERIDVAMERPMSYIDLADAFSGLLGRDVTVRAIPWPVVDATMRLAGAFSARARDFRAMFAYMASGEYVADLTVQDRLFGPAPAVDDSLRRYLEGIGLRVADARDQVRS